MYLFIYLYVLCELVLSYDLSFVPSGSRLNYEIDTSTVYQRYEWCKLSLTPPTLTLSLSLALALPLALFEAVQKLDTIHSVPSVKPVCPVSSMTCKANESCFIINLNLYVLIDI